MPKKLIILKIEGSYLANNWSQKKKKMAEKEVWKYLSVIQP
jgi:hypothetical protein